MIAGRYTLLQYPGKQAHFVGFELSLEGQRIDKAAAKGLLHKNNAAHKKSALTLKLNNIG